MKQIQPITSWSDGQQVQANTLTMYSINDDLSTGVTFYYEILAAITDVDGNTTSTIRVAGGNLNMGGADYVTWGENGDINEAAYIWAAQQLNLTLV